MYNVQYKGTCDFLTLSTVKVSVGPFPTFGQNERNKTYWLRRL